MAGVRSLLASISWSSPATPAEVSISVVLATASDRDDVGALMASAAEQMQGSRGWNARLRHLGKSPEQFFESALNSTGPVVLIARMDATACGLAALANDQPRLDLVFVDPSKRRRGVGRALVHAAETTALERYGAPLSAIAAAGSRAEKSLFEALGYRAELLVMEPRSTS